MAGTLRLGTFFTLAEFEVTSTGLPNDVPANVVPRLLALVTNILDPLRRALGRPVHVTSGYRSFAVNKAIGGSATSAHMQGEAADIYVDGVGAEALAMAIVILGVGADQIIWYDAERGGHVHVSYTADRLNRNQRLWAPADGGYRPWMEAS